MKSLWFRYLEEMQGDHAIEYDFGFVTYRFLGEVNSRAVYMPEIYVIPERRGEGLARILVSEVEDIARKAGKTLLLGSVCMQLPVEARIASMQGHLALGFTPVSAEPGKIWYAREIIAEGSDDE